jgi:hypothetical protein
VILEQRMEGIIANPRFIPENVIAKMPDPIQNFADVVDGAVIGRELDAR